LNGTNTIRLRTWRTWVGAVLAAVVVAALAQLLLHRVFMELGMLGLHLVSGTFHAVIIVVPILLFLAWRTQAQALEIIYKRLQAAESMRDDLVNMLVHDLKSPVISAGLAIRAIARDREAGDHALGHEEEMLAIADDSLRRAEVMIGDILTAARADAGKLDPDLEDANLAEIIRKQVEMSMPRLDEKRLEILTALGDTDLGVRVDVRMMRRVMDNLLENAIKHTPKGRRIQISTQRSDNEVIVSVSDSGHGIPEELREKIFEKFGQASARGNSALSVGLGLVVCKLIVEAHGGRIWVERTDEQGSDFRFSIPLREPAAA
jgi:signal transduction histidine kinase